MKKVSTTVYLTEEQQKKLRWVNKNTGVPMAKLIRDSVDRHLDNLLKEKKGWDISSLQENQANELQ